MPLWANRAFGNRRQLSLPTIATREGSKIKTNLTSTLVDRDGKASSSGAASSNTVGNGECCTKETGTSLTVPQKGRGPGSSQSWLSRFLDWFKRDVSNEDGIVTIAVHVPDSGSRPATLKFARAQIDLASAFDLVSRSWIEEHYTKAWTPLLPGEFPGADLINGTDVRVIGKIEVVWHGVNEGRDGKISIFSFRAKTYRHEFLVSEDPDLPCDFFLGKNIVNQCRLVRLYHFSASSKNSGKSKERRPAQRSVVREKYPSTKSPEEVQKDAEAKASNAAKKLKADGIGAEPQG